MPPQTAVAGSLLSERSNSDAKRQPVNLAQSVESSTVSAEPEVSIELGRWRLESLLGEGRLSQVFRARPIGASPEAAALHAIKLLRESWHDHPVALARFRSEAIIGRCVAHRNVVSVLAAHVHRPPYYVVMPCLAGRGVDAILKARRQLEAPLALWIARQAAEGLNALHQAGYLHGDVKPRNLFFSAQGHVTLVDLTCATRLDEDASLTDRQLIGTPPYLAPELFAGRQPDRRSDFYSLGITLFEMLAGRLPILATDLAAIAAFKRDAALPNLRYFAPQIPSAVADLVRQLTARDPLRRPQSARELIERIVRLEIVTLRERLPA
jgi:serine/threonine-protein kinase